MGNSFGVVHLGVIYLNGYHLKGSDKQQSKFEQFSSVLSGIRDWKSDHRRMSIILVTQQEAAGV